MDTLRPWQQPHERTCKRRPQFGLTGVLFAMFCASGFFAGYHYGARRPVMLKMVSSPQTSFIRSPAGIDPGDLSTILDSVKRRFPYAGLVYTVELVQNDQVGTLISGTRMRRGDIFVWMTVDHGAFTDDTTILYRKDRGKWRPVGLARGQGCRML